jgi:tRNA pseudouridine32 synthase / 23S rRNA pseudouridine746 synthase
VSVYAPPPGKVCYIHTDADLIVIDKPAELLSVPGRGPDKADCALSRVQRDFPDAMTVHRLDMSTSGLLILARTKPAQRHLSVQFEKGGVSKSYVADVWGWPDPAEGLIDLPLSHDWPNRPKQRVNHETGKPSQTAYETIGSHPQGARLRLTPLTGRTHQLRLHLAAVGYPILGDDIYAPAAVLASAPRLHLHAAALTFRHPDSQAPLTFESAYPF